MRPAFSSKYRRAGLRPAMGAAQPRSELLPAELLGPGVTGLADTDRLQVTVEDVPTVVVTVHPGVHDLFGAGLALGHVLRHPGVVAVSLGALSDRKSTRLNSSHVSTAYAA